ncbi:hypothetical protein [Pelagibacterium montanilacus]|uniref:hypothetical protein n=1 Tax=Pelagibacterium montanilacus TaxID=2185280 RepID=UPI000F8DAE63|nr:hypothetical protein [Pelagibacterium montanilacus]
MKPILGGLLRGAGIALAIGALAGCVTRPVGDLGRVEASLVHDEVMPVAGSVRAQLAGEPVSRFNRTAEEIEMSDRIWRFLVAPHADWFHDAAAELQRTRLASALDRAFKPRAYYEHLAATRFASSRARYSRIEDDARADIATLPSTFASICKVIEIDRQRAVALANIERKPSGAAENVAAREWENQQVIGWFTRALDYRFIAYSTALDGLLVETPHEEARGVDAALVALEVFVHRAKAGAFCPSAGTAVAKDGSEGSRFAAPRSGLHTPALPRK